MCVTLAPASKLASLTGPAATYSYDAANRLTSDGSQSFSWNADDQLTGQGSDSFNFDPLDRLTCSTVDGTTRTCAQLTLAPR